LVIYVLHFFFAGVGAAWKLAKVEPGSSVAIFGLGVVGLAVNGHTVSHFLGLLRSFQKVKIWHKNFLTKTYEYFILVELPYSRCSVL
jgi:hypothetical protein